MCLKVEVVGTLPTAFAVHKLVVQSQVAPCLVLPFKLRHCWLIFHGRYRRVDIKNVQISCSGSRARELPKLSPHVEREGVKYPWSVCPTDGDQDDWLFLQPLLLVLLFRFAGVVLANPSFLSVFKFLMAPLVPTNPPPYQGIGTHQQRTMCNMLGVLLSAGPHTASENIFQFEIGGGDTLCWNSFVAPLEVHHKFHFN